jgi:hypothetical protein
MSLIRPDILKLPENKSLGYKSATPWNPHLKNDHSLILLNSVVINRFTVKQVGGVLKKIVSI